MQDQYSHAEVIKILECMQWLALSKGNRLMPTDRSFKEHANTIITICIGTQGMKETIDALIESSTQTKS